MTKPSVSCSAAIQELLAAQVHNRWFVDSYWPENEPRVRRMIADMTSKVAAGSRILDIGCGMGYISFLFSRLGYRVTAMDGWELPERDSWLAENGVEFSYGNLNAIDPFKQFTPGFDAILLGEVIEHILNWPVDLIRSAGAVSKPGALLILTTPNPATVMNAWRVLRNKHSLWGTNDFMALPKMVDGRIIIEGDIHYREYTDGELSKMLALAGFRVVRSEFVAFGVSGAQAKWKQILKRSALFAALLETRPFAAGHYFVAEKSD